MDSSFRYDHSESERLLTFGNKYIVQTKGRWAGKPLVWEPWQRALNRELMLRRPNGERVYKRALIGIARKNGKSTLAASWALYGLCGTPEQSPEVYAAAAAKDQAGIVFRQSADFVPGSSKLLDWLDVKRGIITCKSNKGFFKVLASDAPLQYGLNPSMVVIDELWAHANPELFYALTTADLARENPLVVSITTAGFDKQSICWDQYERGMELKEAGGIDAMRKAGFLFVWFEVPNEDEKGNALDYRDKTLWKRANPSSWITEDRLETYYNELPENVFRRLHLNQWTEAEEAWIKPWQWDACSGKPSFNDNLPTWLGVDLGYKKDCAAIAWAQFHGSELHVGVQIYDPEKEGKNFGVEDVREAVARAAARCNKLEEVNYDPWQFVESAEELLNRGIPMLEFPQTTSRMAPASENLLEVVQEKRLVHDGDKTLREHVLNAIAQETERGGWKISKRKSLERIDGLVAMAMAADRAVTMHLVRPPSRRIFLE